MSLVPLEVAGWLMKKTTKDIEPHPRALLVTGDDGGTLAAGLIARGPLFPMGVTYGLSTLHSSDSSERLTAVAHGELPAKVRTMDSLAPVSWVHFLSSCNVPPINVKRDKMVRAFSCTMMVNYGVNVTRCRVHEEWTC
jgi:hypothetical protein